MVLCCGKGSTTLPVGSTEFTDSRAFFNLIAYGIRVKYDRPSVVSVCFCELISSFVFLMISQVNL